MTRRGTLQDIPRIVDAARRFHAQACQPYPIDELHTASLAHTLVTEPHGAVFLTDDALIAGILTPALLNPHYRQATELLWWSDGRGGREVRQAFEEWARENGAHAVYLASTETMRGPAVGRLLQRGGYRLAETTYRKVL